MMLAFHAPDAQIFAQKSALEWEWAQLNCKLEMAKINLTITTHSFIGKNTFPMIFLPFPNDYSKYIYTVMTLRNKAQNMNIY